MTCVIEVLFGPTFESVADIAGSACAVEASKGVCALGEQRCHLHSICLHPHQFNSIGIIMIVDL